ncbi:MAG: phospho-N-acetylmuramoyl-pentapeptide-transferase [Lachnospiraceae bacterium]|nr:phospho-N-acetylmuramoyl-pentapeptide-transferase [Lachnospiraceae bacterium]
MGWHLALPVFISFFISVVTGPFLIPVLRKLKVGNTEREELESHQKKNGTPTMGGLMFLAAILITSIIYAGRYPKILPVVILTMGFGIIGFIDDYLKVVLKRSDGLIAWQKMLLQIVVTALFAFYIMNFTDVSLDIIIPFMNGYRISIGVLAVPVMFFAVIGTVNGTNFTDGVDGLATSVTIVVALFFAAASNKLGSETDIICLIVFGALMGFLVYNVYPAKVFMGDTGSLALGGFVAGVAYMLNMPLFIIIVGFIYLIEVLSVIIQVTYFKKTHGKRIFRMAPIHHHFELGGWSETKVVAIFTIVTALLAFFAYAAM